MKEPAPAKVLQLAAAILVPCMAIAQTSEGGLESISAGNILVTFEKLQGSVIGFVNSDGRSDAMSDRARFVLGNLQRGSDNANNRLSVPFCLNSIDNRFYEVSIESTDNMPAYVSMAGGNRYPVSATLGNSGLTSRMVKAQPGDCTTDNQVPISVNLTEELQVNSYEIRGGKINLLVKPE